MLGVGACPTRGQAQSVAVWAMQLDQRGVLGGTREETVCRCPGTSLGPSSVYHQAGDGERDQGRVTPRTCVPTWARSGLWRRWSETIERRDGTGSSTSAQPWQEGLCVTTDTLQRWQICRGVVEQPKSLHVVSTIQESLLEVRARRGHRIESQVVAGRYRPGAREGAPPSPESEVFWD